MHSTILLNILLDATKINSRILLHLSLRFISVLGGYHSVVTVKRRFSLQFYNEKSLRELKPPPRIFMFYSWLSVGIAKVNNKSFQIFLALNRDPNPGTVDPDCDPVPHQNLNDWSLGYVPTHLK